MSDGDRGMPQARVVARARFARQVARAGAAVPPEFRTARPVIEWRRKACRCWLLRVHLTPNGWVLEGRPFTVSTSDWVDRVGKAGTHTLEDGTPMDLAAYRAGKFTSSSPRTVEGVTKLLPLDASEWPTAKFELGCPHWSGYRGLEDLAHDVTEFRKRRRAVSRTLAEDGVS